MALILENLLNSKNTIFIILLIAIIAVESLAQTFLKNSIKHKEDIYLYIGIIIYALVGLIYGYLLKQGRSLALANAIWQAAILMIVSIISIVVFKEKLTSKQIIGIGLVLIGGILLS